MVDKMDVDSPSDSQPLRHRDRICRRLAQFGVPQDKLDPGGLVEFAKDCKDLIQEIVMAILPPEEEVAEVLKDNRTSPRKLFLGPTMKGRFRESMTWIQWLMFQGDPATALKSLLKISFGQRGVCGAVWGQNDIAYRCRTCEHDPTCAICVPCFENGNHEGHDYNVIYTGGGCCDCGDVTAWKREGFCSKHKGAEQIQPLPEQFAKSVGPVLDALFACWLEKLASAENLTLENSRMTDRFPERKKVANELTYAVVEMLLEFCKHSESLLSFIARCLFSFPGLLDLLVRGERYLADVVVKKLHELLLKLLGEPLFKYEFAKVFLAYYPSVINDAVREVNDPFKKYPLLSIFAVQIFTVPTLTPRLVKEMNLLAMLLECLGEIFISCAGEDGRLQVSRWGNLFETTLRVGEDIKFVMSHVIVPKYAIQDQQDISRTWMRSLTFVQGMNPQKRETGIHVEEENENVHLPFVLGHTIANIHSLLVDGAFADASNDELDDEVASSSNKHDSEDGDSLRLAKVGRLSQESSACSAVGRAKAFATSSKVSETKFDGFSHQLLPPSVLWLTNECLRAIDNWLAVEHTPGGFSKLSSPNKSTLMPSNLSALKRTLSKFRRGKTIFSRISSSGEDHGMQISFHPHGNKGDQQAVTTTAHEDNLRLSGENDHILTYSSAGVDYSMVDGDFPVDVDSLHLLHLSDWPEIVYDVSSQDISVHIPLHQLLSLLLQKILQKYFGESSSSATDTCSASCLLVDQGGFFIYVLRGCHPYGFSAFVMEHPLRIRVFCAQVHAGMWRKNGDAALLCSEWYRSVRWCEQGLELDLFLLQCCAVLAPADQFVSRIVERYGLTDYLSLNLDRTSEYEPVLVQEMLTLIIQIVKERRYCGLTMADSLKREIIYKLSMGNATRSQLVKSLPRDLSKSEQLQEILDTVAVYSNPSGFSQGMYSLRSTYWKELDLYHPRWSSKELQLAEEKYLRFCNVSALTSQLPRWTKIYPPLVGLSRIVTCKVVMQIIHSVLFYAVFTYKLSESRAPEGVLVTALHLFSLALDTAWQSKKSGGNECPTEDSIPMIDSLAEDHGEKSFLGLLVLLMRMRRKENLENFIEGANCDLASFIEGLLKKIAEIDSRCMIKLQQLAPEAVSQLSPCDTNNDLSMSGSSSDAERRKAKAREKQAAMLETMRAQQSKFWASIDSDIDDAVDPHDSFDAVCDVGRSAQVVCCLCHDHNSKNPVSFLILLQKSRLVSFVNRGPLSWAQSRRLDKLHPSTLKSKEGDMSEMVVSTSSSESETSAQLAPDSSNISTTSGKPEEVNTLLEYFKDQFPQLMSMDSYDYETEGAIETLEQDMYSSIQREMQHTMLSCFGDGDASTSFIVRDANRNEDAGSLLLGKYVAAFSRLMKDNSSGSETLSDSDPSSESTSCVSSYCDFGPSDCDGVHLCSCGHAVHQGCLDLYLSSLKERSIRRIVFEGGHIVDPDQGEFLCPVCRRLVNSVLSASRGDMKMNLQQGSPAWTISDSVEMAPGDNYSLRLQQALVLLRSAGDLVVKDETLGSLPYRWDIKMGENLDSFCHLLFKFYFPGKHDKLLRSARLSPLMLMWDTLKYSLISMEIASRSRRGSLTPNYSLSSLYGELKSASGFVLSILVKIVQKARSKNTLHVLQRLRGIQLFADSICYKAPTHCENKRTSKAGQTPILKLYGIEVSNSDVQFWNRASDPILAYDPFSSLMWVLFCLPTPFLSCQESLLSFVHLFYVVSVAQALMLYCGKHQHDLSGSDCLDFLITDIYKVLSESGCSQQYFVSNYFDPSADIKDTIRRLSFSYLRRCALLWKILHSHIPAPFCDEDDVVLDRFMDDKIDGSPIPLEELNKIQELEQFFKIPSIDVVIKDEVLRCKILAWCNHFCKEYALRAQKSVIHITPAVPFELMRLPHLYQDLLQRYIKQRCPECKSLLDEPALCLLCGKLCCPSWKSCCRESGCQTHAKACGAGTGVFLLIRRTTILLQRSARQAPWPSPYLDAFGEEDLEMHRGKPLFLNEERYAVLTYMVASHGLDRSSKVLGATTIGSFFMV